MSTPIEIDPRLPEVVRHGTTTVVVSNCSLGIAFGRQNRNGEEPIVEAGADDEVRDDERVEIPADLQALSEAAEAALAHPVGEVGHGGRR